MILWELCGFSVPCQLKTFLLTIWSFFLKFWLRPRCFSSCWYSVSALHLSFRSHVVGIDIGISRYCLNLLSRKLASNSLLLVINFFKVNSWWRNNHLGVIRVLGRAVSDRLLLNWSVNRSAFRVKGHHTLTQGGRTVCLIVQSCILLRAVKLGLCLDALMLMRQIQLWLFLIRLVPRRKALVVGYAHTGGRYLGLDQSLSLF